MAHMRLLLRTLHKWYTTCDTMRISLETKDVLSDILVELAVVALISIPGYFIGQDWLRLTLSIVFSILTLRTAISLRKRPYDKPEWIFQQHSSYYSTHDYCNRALLFGFWTKTSQAIMSYTVFFTIFSIVLWLFVAAVLILTAPKPHNK